MIRHLTPSDLPAFKHLRLMALRLEPENYASSHDESAALSDEDWARYLETSDVFAAFEGDEPVALAAVTPQTRARMAHRGSVGMVFVLPERRGGGNAAEFMGS